MPPYRDNFEHLQDELLRLDARLRAALKPDDAADHPVLGRRGDSAAVLPLSDIDRRVKASVAAGVDLRLVRLAQTFDLTGFETEVLLLALAPEIDLGYERIFAHIQNDPGQHRPTVDLALRLACATDRERVLARQAFSERATLLRARLVTLDEQPRWGRAPLTSRAISLDASVASFLLAEEAGVPPPDGAVHAAGDTDETIELKEHFPEAGPIIRMMADRATPTACLLTGYADRHRAVAASIARAIGGGLQTVDVSAARGAEQAAALFHAPFRDALLHGRAVYVFGWERAAIEPQTRAVLHQTLREAAALFPCPVLLSVPAEGSAGGAIAADSRGAASTLGPIGGDLGRRCVTLRLRPPDAAARRMIWRGLLCEKNGAAETLDLSHVAGAFRFTQSQIRDAVDEARMLAELRGGRSVAVGAGDVMAACRQVAALRPVAFARRVTPSRTWDDLILPTEAACPLREFVQQVRHRVRVFDDWAFDARVGGCRGIVALFAGPSGTGKSLAAEVVAGDLGLELYRVDLASVVSKYIGETEKNLDRTFADAQDAGGLLFFDECDALFGKRSEVKDAHDRYANLETGFLLQRLEQHDGPVVLATNFRANIDDAFTRRLSFAVDFPFPDEAHRLRLWRGMFPRQAPLADDVDFSFLARQFRLSGGNIRNAAVASAFLAADGGGAVTMRHVVCSVRREYQKLGRTCERGEFGPYFEWVQ